MELKNKLDIKKILFLFLLIISVGETLTAGVMSKPRRVSVLKTEHFDILFSEPSANSVKYLADHIDFLYDRAKKEFPETSDIRIPVIVSPDSDELVVKYTSSPYNRIFYFEAVPEPEDNVYKDTLLGMFYHEIYLALSQSVRSPFNQFIYKTIGGDKYQPVSFYIPYPFVEGRAFLSDGSFSDKKFLEILSIAKYENCFPTWFQASATKDIYPGEIMNQAAGSAFSAYLMNTYGIDKYMEFWNICGNVNFRLTAGLFKKVYGITIDELWEDFEESIPMPEDLEEIKAADSEMSNLFALDTEGLYQHILVTEYGIVWYDGIRHEVDILDWNSPIKMKQLLFMASDIQKMSLSPDGRYITVSFYGIKSREHFRDDKVWIYDLQKRVFTKNKYKARDGEIIQDNNGQQFFAGINVKDKTSILQILNFNNEYKNKEDKKNKDVIFEKVFFPNIHPDSLTFAGNGRINYLVTENNKRTLNQIVFNGDLQWENEKIYEKSWQFFYKGEPVSIRKLRALTENRLIENKDNHYYLFEYYPENEASFCRMGFIKLNSLYEPEEIYFQNKDIGGGVKFPYVANDYLYFVSDRFDHNDLKIIPLSEISFEKGQIVEQSGAPAAEEGALAAEEGAPAAEEGALAADESALPHQLKNYKIENKMLADYSLERYHPFKYMVNCSLHPFFAVKDLTSKSEQKLWPSLGATIVTQDDPFLNSKIMVSGAGGYLPLGYIKVINPTQDDTDEYNQKHIDDKKYISAALTIENTSTPVDIRMGCLFKANPQGEYSFAVSGNTLWRLPMGMAFSRLDLTMNTIYTASTDYYDVTLQDHFPGLKGWPGFKDAYESVKLSIGAEYSNIHQYGVSKYEEIGLSLGLSLDTFWDISEMRLLKEKYGHHGSQLEDLTEAQRKKLIEENLLEISQLNFGYFAEVKIPQLTPFSMHKGLVLSMPSTVKMEFLTAPGTALDLNVEMLLLGYECQNGISPLYLYFPRIGLKFAYDFKLKYDTHKIPLPDIRKKNNLWNVFNNTYIKDSISLIYHMDFCPAIGKFSQSKIDMEMEVLYYLRSNGLAFKVKFGIYY